MTLLIYGIICVLSAIFLFLMAMLGSDFDTDVDVDIDVDIDMDMDTGEFGGPGILSIKLILFFLIGFGLFGFIAMSFKWPVHDLIVAFAGGLALWYVGFRLLKLLYSQQSNSQVMARTFAGKEARVKVPIPKGGTGEIEAVDEATGQSAYFSARAVDGEAEYEKGRTVKIKSVAGGTAAVE